MKAGSTIYKAGGLCACFNANNYEIIAGTLDKRWELLKTYSALIIRKSPKRGTCVTLKKVVASHSSSDSLTDEVDALYLPLGGSVEVCKEGAGAV